jgi:hypothetical protein
LKKSENIELTDKIIELTDKIIDLKGNITKLENDKLESRRVMIVRQLAQSVQHYMTKQFPADVFKTKFSHFAN